MSPGRRYSRLENRKLNVFKVVSTIIILIVVIIGAFFGIYKLFKRDNKNEKTENIELGREIIHEEQKTENTEKTIDDYLEDYNGVLVEKLTEDTYCVSIDGKESTLYSDGTLAEGRISIWNGESKEIKTIKDKSITINTPEELKWLADQIISGEKNFKDYTIILNSNIDLGGRIKESNNLEGNRWNSIIGFLESEDEEESEEENLKGFAGTFDGNNHWIKGMIIESDKNYQGLFGYLSGTVRNLTIKDSYISGVNGVGAIAGLNSGKLENCKLINTTINGKTQIGGIIGIGMTNSNIDSCSVDENSKIIGEEYVGGILGYLNNNSSIMNCTNKSAVSGKNYIGGIVGISFYGTNINNCSSLDCEIIAEDYVGGIVGYSQSQMERCFNKSKIKGNNYVGGIAGVNYIMGNISLTYNSGEINVSNDFAGGIAGINNATIVSTYNKGNINSVDLEKEVNLGGICGQNLSESAVNNSYNIGTISGKGYIGGIVGSNFGSMANCFYLDSTVDIKENESKTEDEMKNIDLNEDFKEDSNNINNGYKILNWQ